MKTRNSSLATKNNKKAPSTEVEGLGKYRCKHVRKNTVGNLNISSGIVFGNNGTCFYLWLSFCFSKIEK